MSEGKTRLTPEELAMAHSGLCGVSIGDGPCSCLVHWVEALQAENDKLKLDRRGFQIMARKVAGQCFWEPMMDAGKYERAGGDVECPDCRQTYVEHPELPNFPSFHMVCSGKIYKL
jgi:hypothetical protein